MKENIFNKVNYIIIGISVAVIVIGFALMYGSSTEVEFNPDVFSARRITVAPVVCMVGFIGMVVGIIWRRKNTEEK